MQLRGFTRTPTICSSFIRSTTNRCCSDMTGPEVARYRVGHVPKWQCTELDMSRNGYVPKWLCPETAISRNGSVPKWLCPETVMSRSGYVPKRLGPEVAMSRNGYVPKWLCPETVRSRSGYVPKRLCPETSGAHSDNARNTSSGHAWSIVAVHARRSGLSAPDHVSRHFSTH